MQSQLVHSALKITATILREGGTFVAKIFRSREVDELYCQLRMLFASVACFKPRSSRVSSAESFVVCKHYLGAQGGGASVDIPFVVCGSFDDLPDSDMTYEVDEGHLFREPIQPKVRPLIPAGHQ